MESHVETSIRAAGAGLAILAGIAVLLGIMWGLRSEQGRRSSLGFSVSLRDVARCYELTWSPRGLCPRVDGDEPFGSPAYGIWWITILLWLACAAVYLVAMSFVKTIHVYREAALVASGLCICGSLCVAGIWQMAFRMAGTPESVVEKDLEATKRVRQAFIESGVEIDADAPIVNTSRERRKKRWLWISFVLLLIAWILAIVAVALLQPLTYPENQYGVMILLGGGYGLYAGWLFYALTLGIGIATSAESCPDGPKRRPAGVSTGYPASSLPAAFSGLLLIVAVVLVDPVQPLVWVLTLLIFVPKYPSNIWALVISFLAVLGGGVRLYFVRWH